MPRSVRFHPLAAQEAAAASDWYRERSQQAAVGFLAELEHAIQQITDVPETWPSYKAGTRRYVFSVYPYSLIYRLTEREITIVAVAHAKESPAIGCIDSSLQSGRPLTCASSGRGLSLRVA